MKNSHINNIINQMHDLEDGNIWLGANIKDRIGPVGDEEAFIRPLPNLHSVAELVSHMLVWRQSVIRKLDGIKPDHLF